MGESQSPANESQSGIPPAPSTVEEIVTIDDDGKGAAWFVRINGLLATGHDDYGDAECAMRGIRAALTPIVEERDKYQRLYEETKDFAEAEEVERDRLAREVEELRGAHEATRRILAVVCFSYRHDATGYGIDDLLSDMEPRREEAESS